MKQVFAVITALVLMPALNAQAWIGGPWSNGSYNQTGDDGVYEAIATTTNGVGMYRWAVRNNSSSIPAPADATAALQQSNVQFGGLIAAANSNVWYYKGVTYYGRCFGIVNSGMKIVSVTGNASTDGLDNAGNSINGVTLSGPNSTLDTPQPQTVAVSVTDTNSTGNAVTGFDNDLGDQSTQNINPGSLGGNIRYANSSFVAHFTTKNPQVTFKGKGVVSFNGLPDDSEAYFFDGVSDGTTYQINDTLNGPNGEAISTDRDLDNQDVAVSIHAEFYGDSENFSQHGHKRKFIVFGSQVSFTVTP